jgi:transposase
MDQRFLEQCLAQGMSLEAIGKQVGKHPSTVGYWLKKHRMVACNADRHSPKGGITEAQLQACVEEGLTLREIAERLNRSVATVRHWDGEVRPEDDESAASPTVWRAEPSHHEVSDARRHRVRAGGSRVLPLCSLPIRSCLETPSRDQAQAGRGGRRKVRGVRLPSLSASPAIPSSRSRRQGVSPRAPGSIAVAGAVAGRGAQVRLLCANCHAEVEAGVTALPASGA